MVLILLSTYEFVVRICHKSRSRITHFCSITMHICILSSSKPGGGGGGGGGALIRTYFFCTYNFEFDWLLKVTAARKFELQGGEIGKQVTWHTKLCPKRARVCDLCHFHHSFILQIPMIIFVWSAMANTPQLQSSWRWQLWCFRSPQDVSAGHGWCHGDNP